MANWGQLAILSYLFSFAIVAVAAMVQHATGVTLFGGWTASAVETLIQGHDASGSIKEDPLFIFGNFFAVAGSVLTLVFQGLTGGLITDLLHQIPGIGNDYILILVRGVISFSGFMLVAQILTGRINS